MITDRKESKKIRRLFQTQMQNSRKEILNQFNKELPKSPIVTGRHRERIFGKFIDNIIPRRFSVSTGIVIDFMGQSTSEADIIIWDSQNYPKLPLDDQDSLFFAESVKMVIEMKSYFKKNEVEDVMKKSWKIKNLQFAQERSFEDKLFLLTNEIESMKGSEINISWIHEHHIASGAIFYSGGRNFHLNEVSEYTKDIEDEWPDIVLFLDAGKVIIKNYTQTGGILSLYEAFEDCLSVFIIELFELLQERVVNVEKPLRHRVYVLEMSGFKHEEIPFKLSRFPPGYSIS